MTTLPLELRAEAAAEESPTTKADRWADDYWGRGL